MKLKNLEWVEHHNSGNWRLYVADTNNFLCEVIKSRTGKFFLHVSTDVNYSYKDAPIKGESLFDVQEKFISEFVKNVGVWFDITEKYVFNKIANPFEEEIEEEPEINEEDIDDASSEEVFLEELSKDQQKESEEYNNPSHDSDDVPYGDSSDAFDDED